MNGIKDLFASERGIFAILLVVALIASKTVTTAVDSVTAKPPLPTATAEPKP